LNDFGESEDVAIGEIGEETIEDVKGELIIPI
jgi:hypothetical protein